MALVHKSFEVQQSVWKKLRINAEESGVPIRDFLAFVIAHSSPVAGGDSPERRELDLMVATNRLAAADVKPLSRPLSRPLLRPMSRLLP